MNEKLKEVFKIFDIEYSQKIEKDFEKLYELLIEWNKKFNLTAIKEKEEVYTKHFIDSLMLFNRIKDKKSLLDIGSGAGFPGLPLKIAGYENAPYLLESNKKKVSFMDMAIEELELKNTYTLNTRAEIAGRDLKYREKFEVVTARAVAPLNILLEYSASFLKVGSIFIAMKTDEQEIEGARKAMKELSFEIDEIESLILPNTDIQRCNIYFRKTKITSEKYPRADGIPKKKPL